ncbi:MAG: oligosaccharide flippase family protein [Terriglobales bacterium]
MSAVGWLAGALLLLSLAALALTWFGYPLLLTLWARWRPAMAPLTPLRAPAAAWPSVSMIVAAHNEAAHIEHRLRNLWDQDYPAGRMEILVCEDGSADATAELVRALAAGGGPCPVHLLRAARRAGKAAALNRGAAAARGDILVFTDANNEFAPLALRHLMAPFADARVGAVSGCKTVAEASGLGGGEGVYWRYERWLVAHEALTGSTAGAFGEVLALRRDCFRPLPTDTLVADDLFLILAVLAQRRRVAAAPLARSWEGGSLNAGSEFKRRRRMAVGQWRSLHAAWHRGGVPAGDAVKVWFHHVLRHLSALWMLLALPTAALILAAPARALPLCLRLLAGLVLALFAWIAVVAVVRRCGARLGRGEAPYFFVLALAAAAAGVWRYWRNSEPRLWLKVQRAPADMAAPPPGILRGLFWASSSFLLGKLLVFGSVVVLTRLLAPKAFGEVALATSAVSILEILGTLGLTSALIFEEEAVEAAANLCFWITFATSFLELAAAWLLAAPLAQFFHEPALAPMLRALSACLVLNALCSTHDYLLRRQLAFHVKIIPDLGQAAAKGIAAIVLAWMGFGAWSLIWGQVLASLAAAALLWRVVAWRPNRHWDRLVLRRMIRYAKHIYFLDGSSVLLNNLDTLTIGRMLSDVWLGFYTLAFRLPEVVLISVLNVVTRVTFPGFSRLHNDAPRLRHTLLETERYTALITLPLATGMGLLAPAMVYGIYGRHWGPAIPVLQVLALCAGMRCLIHCFGDGYKAIGRPDVLTRTTVLWWIVLPPSIILGAHWGGVVGVAWGQVVTRAAVTLLHVYLVSKYLNIRPKALLRCIAPALEGSALMATALWILAPRVTGLTPRLELAVLVPFGTVVYITAIALLHPRVARAALARLRRRSTEAAQPATASAPELAA